MSRLARALMFFACMLVALPAFAAALVESVSGDVKAGATASAATAVRKDQRINPGSVVVTGPKSQTILRFDDGQAILLNENSEFKISAYSFTRNDPGKDSFVVDLFKGAMRSVSGLLGQRSARAYAVRVPQATIGIRGTDFMVVLYNPAAVSVIQGLATVSNAAGTVAVGAGSIVSVASAGTLAIATSVAALPAGVTASFSSMSSVAITGGAAAGTGAGSGAGTGAGSGAGAGGAAGAGAGGAAGAGAAVGAAAGGITMGVVGIAAAVVGAIAVVGSQEDQAQQTTGTTGTTGSTP